MAHVASVFWPKFDPRTRRTMIVRCAARNTHAVFIQGFAPLRNFPLNVLQGTCFQENEIHGATCAAAWAHQIGTVSGAPRLVTDPFQEFQENDFDS